MNFVGCQGKFWLIDYLKSQIKYANINEPILRNGFFGKHGKWLLFSCSVHRSSQSMVFCYNDVCKNFAKFAGKHKCWILSLTKLQAFICFVQHLRMSFSERQFVGYKAKGRISNGVFKKTKHAIFSEKRVFITPWYAQHTFLQGVRKVRFSENLACFVFLKHPFWDSPFCFITNELLSEFHQVLKNMHLLVSFCFFRSSQQRYSIKQMLLKILQTSELNICVRVSLLMELLDEPSDIIKKEALT